MKRYQQYASEELIRTFEDTQAYLSATNEIFEALINGKEDEALNKRKKALLGTGIELFGELNICRMLHLKDMLMMCDLQRLQKLCNIGRLGLNKNLFKKGAEQKIVHNILRKAHLQNVQALCIPIMDRYKKDSVTFMENENFIHSREHIVGNWTHPPFAMGYIKALRDLGTEEEVKHSLCFVDFYLHHLWTEESEIIDRTRELFTEIDWVCYEILMFEGLYYFLISECKRRERDMEMKNQNLQDKLGKTETEANQQLEEALQVVEERDRTIEGLQLYNAALEQRIKQYEKMLSRTMPLPSERLDNVRVLVVGHPVQKEMYEEEITVRGGIFEFVPSVTQEISISEIKSAVGRADLVLYLTTYTSHKVQDSIKSCVSENQLKYITCNGRATFIPEIERVISEWTEKVTVDERKVSTSV